MFTKGSKLYSVVNNKCPRCNEGDFYKTQPYNLKSFGLKNQSCTVCKLKFEKEPGFFYGSLYITYAFGVALFVTWWIFKTVFFPSMSIDTMVLWMMFIQIVLAPPSLYYGKLIWLNIFESYNSNYD